MQQPDRFEGDEWSLLRGLRHHRVAGGKRGGNLSGENSQRKIPRTDADKDTPAAIAQLIALPGRAGQYSRNKNALRLGSVVAAEVSGLAHFGDTIVERLAALALQQRYQTAAGLFDQIAGPL